MVVQKSWNVIDTASHQNNNSTESTSSSWSFPAPVDKPPNPRPCPASATQTKQTVSRQIAINTLAAMHRRFSLPGPVQPHSRPIAEFRASANKSLDMLRQTIQSAVTRDIDQVIKKYLEKFFVPAVNNIRLNLGEESVSEDQVRAVCRAMLDATRLLYSTPPKPTQSPLETSDMEPNSTETKFVKQNLQSPSFKRKEMDSESDGSSKRKRNKLDDDGNTQGLRDPDKWNPARLTQDTLFIMGSHAHKVLGMGNNRGRLYTKHAGLLRYPADTVDKEWIANHNLVNAVGGKTYIMVLEDIEELANSEAYRHSSLPMLGELTGFKVPPFILRKIKSYVMKRSMTGESSNPESPLPSTSITDKLDSIKVEIDTDSCNQILDGEYGNLPLIKDVSDFADIKVDEIKVEDLDVDNIKVENIDDINVENIKEEDIKLENDDTLSVCKQTEDEQDQLVDGLLDADIDFLSSNLGDIESDADARKTIEKLTGANPDTITLVGDEFDLGTTLNTNNFSDAQTMKCITVASTTSGMVHSVPVAHLAASPRLSGSTVHYYCSPATTAPNTHRPSLHHLPRGTLTIQTIPGTNSQMLRGIPITAKTGKFSTVMSPSGSIIGFGTRTNAAAIIGSTAQYVNVTSKSFTTGNILHNAIVSRNILNRNNLTAVTSGVTYNVRPVIHTTTPKINTITSNANDYDSISTTRDMIDNACNSSVMLKKVLTLGSSGAAKSFMMHNTQKILSTGFANGSAPPNVTLVSSGPNSSGHLINNNIQSVSNAQSPPSSTLSASHATLSALLSSSADGANTKN